MRRPEPEPLTRAAVLALLFACYAPQAAIDTIIPMPKQVRTDGRPVLVEGFRICAHSGRQSQIAAAEIGERITALGAASRPVLPLTDPLPVGNLIVIAPCSVPCPDIAAAAARARVTPTDPGEQGYAIHVDRRPDGTRLFLIGSDALGALYAGVTLRQLITGRGDGVVVQPAHVRDWPDYKHRQNGVPFSEPLRGDWYGILSAERKGDLAKARSLADGWVALQKRYVDWMLRAKINMAWNSTNIRPGDAPADTTAVRSALRRVHEYALERGIESAAGDTTAIGTYPRDKDNADFADVVFHRAHKRYFCWSRLTYHEERARRAASWLAEAGYTGYYLHATDGGSWENPALWKNRCELCRETYGDDHAKADSVVFGLYHREIRRRIPNLKFIAVVYPYTGRYLDPDYVYGRAAETMGEGAPARAVAEDTVKGLTAFLGRLDSLLPPDIFVCIRESERRHLDLARQAWGKRPFQLYFEYGYWKGWRPYFVTTPLWTRSMFYPTHRDILFGNVSGGGWTEATQLLGAECSWNTTRPGARDFDSTTWREIGTRQTPPPERKTFAERACRFWFGEEAGPLMAPFFAENISHTFIHDPDEVLRLTDIDEPVRTMSEQAAAASRAASALDQLWALQQDKQVLDGDLHGYFLNAYLMTHGARVLAAHRAKVLAARQAIRAGSKTETEKHLSSALSALEQEQERWDRVRANARAGPLLAPHMRASAAPGYLSQLDLGQLRREVEDLWERREKLIAAHTIPAWFERTCRTRTIVAAEAASLVTVDGELTEDAWDRCPPVEHFVDHRVLRLESLETRARLCFREDALYVAFECFDPDPSGIRAVLPGRDQHVLCDSVELLVAPRPGSREFLHWIIDSRGTVFDAKTVETAAGLPKYSSTWDSAAVVRAACSDDRWTVEMAIPAAELGVPLRDGAACTALLCRNVVHTRPDGEAESNAIIFLEGDGFRTVGKFARLALQTEAGIPDPQVEMTLRPMQFRHQTTGEGAGTSIGGDLLIETDRNLHDVRLTVACTDGVRPLGNAEVGAEGLVRLLWRPSKPFSLLLPVQVPGVACVFTLTSQEGTWEFQRRFGSPHRRRQQDGELFRPGKSGQALCSPAFFSSAEGSPVQLSQGTIEFWVRPRWDAVSRPPGPRASLEHTFLNLGPIRPEHPYLSNRDSLTIYHSSGNQLVATVSNSRYEARTVQAGVSRWRTGQWHHVALQWNLDDGGETAMALFVDGALASDRCVGGGASGRSTSALAVRPLPLPVQIGSMNTGYRPADADIDELRISSAPRYSDAFEPAERLEADAKTLSLFHFDGSLDAVRPAGLSAFPGPAQSSGPAE